MVLITIVHGVYKATDNWEAPHCRVFPAMFDDLPMVIFVWHSDVCNDSRNPGLHCYRPVRQGVLAGRFGFRAHVAARHAFFSGIPLEKQRLRGRGYIEQTKKGISGWWFGPFFIFPYIGKNHPNWLSYFSGGLKPPTRCDEQRLQGTPFKGGHFFRRLCGKLYRV